MIIVKYIFLFIIFSVISIIGNLIAKKYKNRVRELKDFKEMFNILESKIKFTYEPLGEIFKEMSEILDKRKNIKNVIEETSNNLKNRDFKSAWENSINKNKTELSLNNEDINVIKGLGNLLRQN